MTAHVQLTSVCKQSVERFQYHLENAYIRIDEGQNPRFRLSETPKVIT